MSIEVVFEKKIKNAAVYRDLDVVQNRQNYLLTSLAAIFVMSLLFYGWQQYRWVQLGYEKVRLQAEKAELLEYQRALLLQRDSLASSDRIDLIARTRLGMGIPAPGQIATLVPNGEGYVSPAVDDMAAPLSAANLNVNVTARRVQKSEERCDKDSDADLSTSGGSSAERCQEAR